MTLQYSTIGLVGAVVGGAAAYSYAPEINQYSETVRLLGCAGIGLCTGLSSRLAAQFSVEAFGGQGVLRTATALAFAAAAGYGAFEFSKEPAGNLIREYVVKYGANDHIEPAAPAQFQGAQFQIA